MPDALPDRRSMTVRKIGTELNRAVEIRKALAEHADDPALILDTIEGETNLAEACCVVLEEIHEDEALLEGLKAKLDAIETLAKARPAIAFRIRQHSGGYSVAIEKASVGLLDIAPAFDADEQARAFLKPLLDALEAAGVRWTVANH